MITPNHPVYKLPDPEHLIGRLKAGDEEVRQLLEKREAAIRLEKEDPFRGTHILQSWRRAEAQLKLGFKELLLMGGNRSGKSTYCAWKVMKTLCSIPEARAWCFQTNSANSIARQQKDVWHMFPREWRYNRASSTHNVKYSQKHGFTEANFVLPNRSQCWFRNYEQNRDVIEGDEVDIIWFDELVPADWVETARLRLVDRGGIMLVSFTPVRGYTPTVALYLQGARTLEYMEVDPTIGVSGRVPLLQAPVSQNARIVYFPSIENPYTEYEEIKKTVSGSPKAEKLCRLYGVATKARTARFPLFRDDIHVLPPDRIPKNTVLSAGEIERLKADKKRIVQPRPVVTTWQYVDPCPGRNWFAIWVRVDALGNHYVFREWPSMHVPIPNIGILGLWAEPDGKHLDGKRGAAQDPLGFGLEAYINEFRRVEGNEVPFVRYMDSRYANAPTQTRDGGSTLIQECAKIGMLFRAAPGDPIEEGVDMVNSLLFYEQSAEISYTNHPKLYVSEECVNTIYSLHEWTGEDGKTGACKDPIDCLRYMALTKPIHIEDDGKIVQGGGSY